MQVSDCEITNNQYGITNVGTLTISGSTISNNFESSANGGGVVNSGTLTAANSTISYNDNYGENDNGYGGSGGVYNTNQATLAGCTIIGNFAPYFDGGGVENAGAGTLIMSGCTISDNAADVGGGVGDAGGVSTLTDCTISNNTAAFSGGGFAVGSTVSVKGNKLVGCTITGNNAGFGAGVYDGFKLKAENCTISANTATSRGRGVYDASNGSYFDCTIAGNAAMSSGGGFFGLAGSTVTGCIIANNTAPGQTPNVSDSDGLAGSYNLIGPGSSGGLLSSNNNLLDITKPVLGTLGNWGGPTETMPLLPGSPAIGAGESIAGITTDERGVARPATDPDIGAFQDQGFTITITSGGTQSVVEGHNFGEPLSVEVISPSLLDDPVAGGVVTFTVPATGASATLSSTAATISLSGAASVTGTANDETGSYVIAASASGGSSSADFGITNVAANAVDAAIEQLAAITSTTFADNSLFGSNSKRHG
jgi:hypothetical protein